jgi:CheY-like chemotaxis protein
MSGERAILCVDDEAIIVISIKQELKARYADGYIYETALNAEDALDLLGQLKSEGVDVALVISDWLMPGMKGDELLRRVKESGDAKTILVTGQADSAVLDALIRDGVADEVVRKPWAYADFMRRIERCLAKAS